VDLTPEGFKNCEKVIPLILQLNEILKNSSDEKILEIYEEYKCLQIIEFE